MSADLSGTANSITSNPAVIGACVESLTDEGYALPPGTIDKGNYAICHFMYYLGISAENTRPPLNGIQGVNWGEVVYYNEQEWGSGGDLLTGQSVQTLGKRLDYYTNGFTQSTYDLDSYTTGSVYTLSWYQPAYAATYCADCLRRYNGGATDFNKVRGYCVSARVLTSLT